MPKVIKPYATIIVQLITLTIDDHIIHNNRVSFDRATLVAGNEPPINYSRRTPVGKDPRADLAANGQNTQSGIYWIYRRTNSST